MQTPAIIVDTSVLTDFFVESRERHSVATTLAHFLRTHGVRVRLPMHALFELASSIRNERDTTIDGSFQMSGIFTEGDALDIETLPIDQAFFQKYFLQELPYMKASDSIFVAMAKVDGAVLITEDAKQCGRAIEAGVEALNIQQFLEKYA